MNLKLILILSIIVLVCGCNDDIDSYDLKYSDESFSYEIHPCDGSILDNPDIGKFDIGSTKNTINWKETKTTYCSLENRLHLELNKYDADIVVNRIFDSDDLVSCSCPIEIEGQINDITDGEYTLSFAYSNIMANSYEVYKKYSIELRDGVVVSLEEESV